jgi:hypothetical protein
MSPKLRIAIWACTGALIVLLWNLAYVPRMTKVGMVVADISCPILLLTRSDSISLAVGLIANTITYILIGLCVEDIRRKRNIF